jgi:hypothetical protein
MIKNTINVIVFRSLNVSTLEIMRLSSEKERKSVNPKMSLKHHFRSAISESAPARPGIVLARTETVSSPLLETVKLLLYFLLVRVAN